MTIRILAVSDVEQGILYSERASERFRGTDLVVSCGDLPMTYLDLVATVINAPLYYVVGNHQYAVTGPQGKIYPSFGHNLHRSVRCYEGELLMAGVEGSLRYNRNPKQYTQPEMWQHVLSLVPGLFWNRARYGRFLDLFVTHAPPWKIHDQEDCAHTGIRAFRWLDKVFKPRYHLHGHVHVYRSDTVTQSVYYQTTVLNCYGCREICFEKEEYNQKHA